MGKREEKLNEMKKEYKEHTMSERQVLEMKKKIEQAKRENRKNEIHHRQAYLLPVCRKQC